MARKDAQFERGKSSNPTGKAKGIRNRTTLALEALLEGEAESITRKAIEFVQNGDTVGSASSLIASSRCVETGPCA